MLLRFGVANKLYTKIFVVPEVPPREPQELPRPQAEPQGPQGQQRRPSINGLVNTAVLWLVRHTYGKYVLRMFMWTGVFDKNTYFRNCEWALLSPPNMFKWGGARVEYQL